MEGSPINTRSDRSGVGLGRVCYRQDDRKTKRPKRCGKEPSHCQRWAYNDQEKPG